MTEPIMDFTDVPEQAEQSVEKPRRRGRPRSEETMKRDEHVYTVLKESGPLTRNKLVEVLDMLPNMVYLSLWRLKREGRVSRNSDGADRHVWQAL